MIVPINIVPITHRLYRRPNWVASHAGVLLLRHAQERVTNPWLERVLGRLQSKQHGQGIDWLTAYYSGIVTDPWTESLGITFRRSPKMKILTSNVHSVVGVHHWNSPTASPRKAWLYKHFGSHIRPVSGLYRRVSVLLGLAFHNWFLPPSSSVTPYGMDAREPAMVVR